eukprot:PhM_4_TR9516/c1_g1_i1/m.58115
MATTQGGEALVQSTLSGELAEVVDIYHEVSLGKEIDNEKYIKLLRAVLNDSHPENYRVRISTCILENAAKFPDSIGDTLQTLLSAICFGSRSIQEVVVRGMPWLCKGAPEDRRGRMVCELSDVLLQVAMTGEDNLRTAADRALEELTVIDSKAVVSKLFVWISDARSDESDAEVCKAEKAFALEKLRNVLSKKESCLTPETIQELAQLLTEQICKCKTATDVGTIFDVFRSMKGFDDRICARVISNFMAENALGGLVAAELIVRAPAAAKRLDAEAASAFASDVLLRKNVRLTQAVATIASTVSDEAAQKMFPGIVSLLVDALPDAGLPSNLSVVEALLSIFLQFARKVPTLTLKLLEARQMPGEPQQLFEKFKALKMTVAEISKEVQFAAKRAALAGTATREEREAYTCLCQLTLSLEELTKDSPKFPGAPAEHSWETPYQPKRPNEGKRPENNKNNKRRKK